MATKKSRPTLAALNAQIAALQAQADVLRKKEVAEVISKVKDAIAHYGLTAADLGLSKAAGNVGKSPAAVGSKPMKKRRKNAAAKPAVKPVKFRDDQGHTWGGIGKRPDWFKAALASGKTPEDLLAKG
jgi:DNA-binding protein H-NS